MKYDILSKISLHSALAIIALAGTAWLPGTARAADDAKMANHDPIQMRQIKTLAQAEALKPGDSIAMVCAMCKIVTVQTVAADVKHTKMMTPGEKMKCPACEGAVEVVATGKGTGKDAEVKYVCSECGDDAMFVTATKPGSGGMKDHGRMKKMMH